MSTNVESKSSVAGTTGDSKGEFANCIPKRVTAAKVMDEEKVKAAWNKMYAAAGISNVGEEGKKALRCAVYLYLAVNGTSPAGTYKGIVQTATGVVMRASEIPAATGTFEVRQFARGNVEESLRFFRSTGILEVYPAVVAKCTEKEIPPSDAFGLVDWFDVAPALTPTEHQVQKKLKNFGLSRARRARGGQDMDDIRAGHYQESLDAQGVERPVLPPASGW